MKKITYKELALHFIFLFLTVLTFNCGNTKLDGGNNEVVDKNPYLITTDGDPSHLSQNQIDAEYNTFLFVGGETRKIYFGGKLPSIHSNYNAVWLNSSLWNPRLAVSLPSENIDNNDYYYVQLAPNDVQATDNNYPIVANVGYEFGSSYTSYQTKNCTLKTTAFNSYRDWGLNVYQQSSYNSLDLTKSSIVKAFNEMNVYLGNNGANIISQKSNLQDLIISIDYSDPSIDQNPALLYAYSQIYEGVEINQAFNMYFDEHPYEGLLFFVKNYNLINPPAPPAVPPIWYGITFGAWNNDFKIKAPVSFVFVQKIKDEVSGDWEDKEIKRTTIHELGHNWCKLFTDELHLLWHNGDNKKQCSMKYINYTTAGVPAEEYDKKVLNHLGFCEGHLQRGMNISWQLKQYTPLGELTEKLVDNTTTYASNLPYNNLEENELNVELVCKKKDFIQGELIDVLVKIKNLTNKNISLKIPKHYLIDKEKDTVINGINSTSYGGYQLPPFGDYYLTLDPLSYIGYNEKDVFPGYPWYYWKSGSYEYYISFEIDGKPVSSNSLSINILPPPDSLANAFSDLKEDMNNIPKLNFENYQVEKYETLAEKYKNTFFEEEFTYKLLKNTNYYFAIQNKDEAKCLRERALQLYKEYIIKHPNSNSAYTLFKWLYYNYHDNKDNIEEIINSLKISVPDCWLLLVLRNQPEYMFKELKQLIN